MLFLGDDGPHQPQARADELLPVLAARGMTTEYTGQLADLNPDNLARFDALIIYANHVEIAPEQEAALLGYVAGGGGLVALHCASYCFHNSPAYIELVGAQFARHGTGEFVAEVVNRNHPVTSGLLEFRTWDETYVHTRHNPDREVLMVREDGEGAEPWTWVRTHGEGRVFYTAYGHDTRTFTHPGFHRLVERAVRWVAKAPLPEVEKAPFAYQDAEIAFYPPQGAPGILQDAPRQMQLPLPPGESVKHMVLPAGFEARLFASEPEVFKVIAMNWDEGGRLWVAETVDYPNDLRPAPEGRDRIRICEDTDGDGMADQFTLFADQLSIPTSLVFARGGVIVAQAPDMLFLQDTDGDGAADVREVLFSGWNTGDTHSGPSNLRWGLDNWIWGTVGYSGFDGEVNGQPQSFRMGVFRFRPDGSALEFIAPTNNNTWGLGLSETGGVFVSTANGNHHDHLAIPNRYFESVGGMTGTGLAPIHDHIHIHPVTPNVRQVDWHGQFTAASGCALYTARAWPERYWNRVAFITEPTGHLVHECIIEPDGSGYVARDGWNLLASADEWTAPILAEVGPDGQVWISDWYNYIVQHNPTPKGFENGPGNAYVTPLRDKTHGRIYRIVYEDAPLEDMPDLRGASAETLLSTLGHDNLFWRMHAQRLLVESQDGRIVPRLVKLAGDTALDAIGNAPLALHALSALDGLGFFAPDDPAARDLVLQSLRHPAPAVRQRAAQISARYGDMTQALLPLLEAPEGPTRLQALLALSEANPSDAAGAAVAALFADAAFQEDAWLPQAGMIAGARHVAGFLHAASAMPANETLARAVATVSNHYGRGGAQDDLAGLLRRYAAADGALGGAFLGGLTEGWPAEYKTDHASELETALEAYGEAADVAVLLAAANFTRKSGLRADFAGRLDEIGASLRAALTDETQNDAARLAAAAQLARLDPGRATRQLILDQITITAPPGFTAGLFDLLRQDDGPALGANVLARFEGFTPAVRAQAIDLLLARPVWTRALLDAVEQGTMGLPALSVAQRHALLASSDAAIRDQAQRALKAAHREDHTREGLVESLMPLTKQPGDPALGRQVFEENCMACHSINGGGGQIAPDLTGIAGGNREEILIAIIDPNRSVESNFLQWTVETKDGLYYSGLLAQENQTSFGLYDARGALHTILREDVERLAQSELSVMPEGFEALPAEHLAGLLAYLTEPHDFLPLDLSAVANTVSTAPMFTGAASSDPYFERLLFDRWGMREFDGVPYRVHDPGGDARPNLIMLHSPHSALTREKPRSVVVPCRRRAKALHLLSGVSGWGHPLGQEGSVSMIVRIHYADGEQEEHPLRNGVHFADYIRVIDVPGSRLAFELGGRQLRQLTIVPERNELIEAIEFEKGSDDTAPMVMAVTVALAHE